MQRRSFVQTLLTIAGLGFLIKNNPPYTDSDSYTDSNESNWVIDKDIQVVSSRDMRIPLKVQSRELFEIGEELAKCKIDPANAFDAFMKANR